MADAFEDILNDVKAVVVLIFAVAICAVLLIYFFAYLPTTNLPVEQQSSITSIESTAVNTVADPTHLILIVAAVLISAIALSWGIVRFFRKQ